MVTLGKFNTVFAVLILMAGAIIAAVVVRIMDTSAPDPRVEDIPAHVHMPGRQFIPVYPLSISIFDPQWNDVLIDEGLHDRALLPPAVTASGTARDAMPAFGVCGPALPCVP